MTLPIEEALALLYARDFIRRLLDPRKTPKVPKSIRMEARSRLKHYPCGPMLQSLVSSHYGPGIAEAVRCTEIELDPPLLDKKWKE